MPQNAKQEVKLARRPNIFSRIGRFLVHHSLEILISFILLYATLPFVAPIAFKLGLTDVGAGIEKIYSYLCHERVERSIFLFGQEGLIKTYTVPDLQQRGVIPLYNFNAPIPQWRTTYFGYPYWGNDQVGYKVSFCIRDIGLYWGISLTSIFAYWWVKKKGRNINVNWKLLVLLMLPMAIDGVFQTSVEVFNFPVLPGSFTVPYIANNAKRIITGVLFGIGFGLFMVKSLTFATTQLETVNKKLAHTKSS